MHNFLFTGPVKILAGCRFTASGTRTIHYPDYYSMDNQTSVRERNVDENNNTPPAAGNPNPAPPDIPQREPEQFLWIKNEGLLRDEGILFGIAAADIADKLAAIDHYYSMQNASDTQLVKRLQENLQQNLKDQDEKKNELIALSAPQPKNPTPHQFFPVLMQLVVYLAVAGANLYLVNFWMIEFPFPICLGIYLFGISGLFIGASILYNHNAAITTRNAEEGKREKWKVYLEEFGIPLVTSAAIVALSWKYWEPIESICVGLLCFFLFLYTGKAAISLFYRIRKEGGAFFRIVGNAWKRSGNRRGLKLTLKRLKRAASDLEQRLQEALASIERNEADRDYRIKLFRSEYTLAGSSREQGVEPSSIQK